jgi:hypothetical protein
MKRIVLYFFALVLLLSGCAVPRQTSVLVSTNYDKEKNETNYMYLPYGSAKIRGEWKKEGERDNSSRQQHFINKDSIVIAIAFNHYRKFEFNTDGAKKGIDFVKAFFKWETDYFLAQGIQNEIIETNVEKNYIIYRFFKDKTTINTYFLVAESNGNYSNFSIFNNNKWSHEKKITFLTELFERK